MFFWKQEEFIKIRKKKGNFWGIVFPFCTEVLKIHWYIAFFLIWRWLFIIDGHRNAWDIINLIQDNPQEYLNFLQIGLVIWGLDALVVFVCGMKKGIIVKNIKCYIRIIKSRKMNKQVFKCICLDLITWFEVKLLIFILFVYYGTFFGLKPMIISMESNYRLGQVYCIIGYLVISIKVISDIIKNIIEELRIE